MMATEVFFCQVVRACTAIGEIWSFIGWSVTP